MCVRGREGWILSERLWEIHGVWEKERGREGWREGEREKSVRDCERDRKKES